MQFDSAHKHLMATSLSSKKQPQQTPSTVSLFIEHLTNLDFSYIDPEVGLSGQSWVVDLEIKGDLNHQGMLLDFGDIKKLIKADIESLWDHKLLVPTGVNSLPDEKIKLLSPTPGVTQLIWHDKNNHYFCHTGPTISLYTIETATLNPTFLAQHLEKILMKKWNSPQLQEICIHFREEGCEKEQSSAAQGTHTEDVFFQYSHGLRLHKGACQRIAHGHRSKIRVFTQQGYHLEYSQLLATHINHGYFLDSNNIQQATDQTITLGYEAPEGTYQLSLPKQRCIVMNTETTVENIATYLLQHARHFMSPDISALQVYEGWLKGAIARHRIE